MFTLVSARSVDCWGSLGSPRRDGSVEYPQSVFWAEIGKIMYNHTGLSFCCVRKGFWGQGYTGVFSWCYFNFLFFFCNINSES